MSSPSKKTKTYTQWPLVQVIWADASKGGSDWEDFSELESWAKEALTPGSSLGHLVHEDEDTVTIVAHDHPPHVLHYLKIPRAWIVDIRYLRAYNRRGGKEGCSPKTGNPKP